MSSLSKLEAQLRRVDVNSPEYKQYQQEELPRLSMFLKLANINILPYQKEILLRLHYAEEMEKKQ